MEKQIRALTEQNVEEKVAQQEVERQRPRLELTARGRSTERRRDVRRASEMVQTRGFIGTHENAGRAIAAVAERTGEMPVIHRRTYRRSPSIRGGMDQRRMDKYIRQWEENEQFRLQKALLGCTKESIGRRVGGAWYPLGPAAQMPDIVVDAAT
ncbi:MAG: hypothetical protein GY768_21995, partial [Planctomycetaceae bacterium]|nr:hypothetical protein [Planctomycetaceae bacterium]